MNRVYNIPQLLDNIQQDRKVFPKEVFYQALKFQAELTEYGLFKQVNTMLNNAKRERYMGQLSEMDKMFGVNTICKKDFKFK